MTDLFLARPELFLAVSGLILLLLCAMRGEKGAAALFGLTEAVFVGTLVLLFAKAANGVGFGGFWIADAFGRFVKAMLLVSGGLALALAPGFTRREKMTQPEYPVLILFAVLGMMLMTSAHHLIALYVGLELQNLSLYILTACQRDNRRASEAGVKYFTLGALSSAVLLFGLSLLYGFAGTASYEGIAALLSHTAAIEPGLAAGLAFVLAGLAFKIAAVPFHMWSPDVYEGAPTPVTAFLAAAPKIAAVAMIARFLIEAVPGASSVWLPLIIFLAVTSMLVGGFAGLVQTNLKRLMAYSGMINIGTILIGLAAFNGASPSSTAGVEGMLVYLALYVCGVLAVFAVLLSLLREGRSIEKLDDLAGLAKTHPLLALAMGAALFSLAGIPPFAGFFGKYLVLLAAVQAGYVSLAVLGVVASVVAAGYYLRIVKLMYFDPPASGNELSAAPERAVRFVVVLTALVVTFFILVPAPLMDAAHETAQHFMSP